MQFRLIHDNNTPIESHGDKTKYKIYKLNLSRTCLIKQESPAILFELNNICIFVTIFERYVP